MRHVDIHGARLAVKVEAPGFLQDLLAAEDESAVFGQGEEQIKFLGAQVEGPGGEADFPPGRVNRQITEMDGSSVIHLRERSPRRKIALTRATSSRGLNGLVR